MCAYSFYVTRRHGIMVCPKVVLLAGTYLCDYLKLVSWHTTYMTFLWFEHMSLGHTSSQSQRQPRTINSLVIESSLYLTTAHNLIMPPLICEALEHNVGFALGYSTNRRGGISGNPTSVRSSTTWKAFQGAVLLEPFISIKVLIR